MTLRHQASPHQYRRLLGQQLAVPGAHLRALVAVEGSAAAEKMHVDAAAGCGGAEDGGAGVHCACRVAEFEELALFQS